MILAVDFHLVDDVLEIELLQCLISHSFFFVFFMKTVDDSSESKWFLAMWVIL